MIGSIDRYLGRKLVDKYSPVRIGVADDRCDPSDLVFDDVSEPNFIPKLLDQLQDKTKK